MDENKKLKTLYLLIAVTSFIFLIATVDVYRAVSYNNKIDDFSNINLIEDNDYIPLIKLGLVPSAPSRQPTQRDRDTGIKLRDGDNNVYSLMESRTWITKDYGNTFAVKIN